ncbi:hypothetical protein ACLBXX_02710 [Microbacterium sp. C23T]
MTDNATPHLLDRAHTDKVLYLVAVSAFTYYPGKELDEPGYTIDEDVTACLNWLAGLTEQQIDWFGETMRTLIADPTADRRPFLNALERVTAD